MRALVVYESLFGNTELIARAVAAGLAGSMDVDVRPVTDVRSEVPQYDLVVIGGPTHAFTMSTSRSRADAWRRGARAGTMGTGMRDRLPPLTARQDLALFAAFDTRIHAVRWLPGSAARAAARRMRRAARTVERARSFYVRRETGPLMPGEEARAQAWGESLASRTRDYIGSRHGIVRFPQS